MNKITGWIVIKCQNTSTTTCYNCEYNGLLSTIKKEQKTDTARVSEEKQNCRLRVLLCIKQNSLTDWDDQQKTSQI